MVLQPLSNWLSNSGQVSYELIIVFAAVIGLVTMILSNYVVIKDSTIALIIAKEKTIDKLSQIDSMEYIEEILFETVGDDTIKLDLILSGGSMNLDTTAFKDYLRDEIILRSKYETVHVCINGTDRDNIPSSTNCPS
ncbi:MAG: hypothetical protein ABID38_00880 [Candidatus Diapherotrites archaeon]